MQRTHLTSSHSILSLSIDVWLIIKYSSIVRQSKIKSCKCRIGIFFFFFFVKQFHQTQRKIYCLQKVRLLLKIFLQNISIIIFKTLRECEIDLLFAIFIGSYQLLYSPFNLIENKLLATSENISKIPMQVLITLCQLNSNEHKIYLLFSNHKQMFSN